MIIWLVYIFCEAFIQAKLIKAGNKPIYIELFIIRSIVSILHGIFLNVQPGIEYIILLGFQICSFWVIFDIVLNKLRNKPFLYRGSNSGWLDRIKSPYYEILKPIALSGTIFFYIKGLNYWKF